MLEIKNWNIDLTPYVKSKIDFESKTDNSFRLNHQSLYQTNHTNKMGNSFSYTPFSNDFAEDQCPPVLKPVRNSYATWSVALKALYDAAILDNVIFIENRHAIVAHKLNDSTETPVESAIGRTTTPVSLGELIDHILSTPWETN